MSQKENIQKTCVLGQRYTRRGKAHQYITGERLKAREAILEASKGADFVQNSCLCGSSGDDLLLATIDRWGLPVSAVLCQNCGLIRLNPRWENTTYIDIYQKYFWPLQTGSFEVTKERFQLSVTRAEKFVDVITSRLNLTGLNVVEIGCSYGAGLHALKGTGATLVGYDYDERILQLGKEFTGLDLRAGGLKAALDHKEKFDVVILRHVFEHFLDPLNDAQSLKQLLSEKGKIFIEVPGVFNAKEWSPEPLMVFNAFHTYYYSLKTLTNVLQSCGFVGDGRNDEEIFSIWSLGTSVNEVSWPDRVGVQKTLDFLLEREQLRASSVNNSFFGNFIRKIKDIWSKDSL